MSKLANMSREGLLALPEGTKMDPDNLCMGFDREDPMAICDDEGEWWWFGLKPNGYFRHRVS